ncbi:MULTISPECIES: DUF2589 domain-containing protein [Fusobacterium]|uniref:DUF2589 domain-containing protein n=1 Tax=Fusobacterium TaxID=848 RepID=UPI0015A1B519|nr:DUF2589 domain-containing protein [Fusobacterium ulcerans]
MIKCYPWKFRKSQNDQSLSDITRGLLYSANAAQQILNNHYIESIAKYFDEDGNPIMYNFKVQDNKKASIPLLALTEPKGLRLKEIEIDLNVRIDEGKVKTKDGIPEEDEVRYADRTSFEVTLAPTSDNTKGRTSNNIGIKLKFEEQDNPEGIERIMDEFRNRPLIYTMFDTEENEEEIEEEEEEIEEVPKKKNSLKKKRKKALYDEDDE